MADSIRFKVHSWLADHVKGVQYPRQEYMPNRPRAPFFKYPMPWWQRLAIFQLSLVALLVSSAMLAVGLLVAYVVIVAIIKTW